LALERQLLTLWALVREGCIDGVVGYFVRNGVMTQPFFGYDTDCRKSWRSIAC
jgi:hypothetical protein